MRSLERGARRETLEKAIARIAFAYGFTMPPVQISRKAASAAHADTKTAASLSLIKSANVTASAGPLQLWGALKTTHGTALSLAVVGTKQAIGNALVVKTALSIVELSGLENPSVLVSSVGDAESKRRFTRELGNFFRKNAEHVPQELKSKSASDPDSVYRELLLRKDPLMDKAPRTIDYLSENSRKVMMETLSFFESVGIGYAIDARLSTDPSVAGDLVFAIDATDKTGARIRIATGGRFETDSKKNGPVEKVATAITLALTKQVRLDAVEQAPNCFVVHVGEAAKLKAFILLESLWKSHVSVTQSLMADNFREQIEKGKLSGAKYLAIMGQREALDSTIIVRNIATQMQSTLPLEKLEGFILRGARS